MKYAAVIAAAGLSSRMKAFKPLLCLGETTIIESVIQNLRSVDVQEIVVVTGYRTEQLQKHLQNLGVRSVENTRFAETKMYDSLCLGLKTLDSDYNKVFLTPGDVPLVKKETLQLMKCSDSDVIRPICNGEQGHPVLITKAMAAKLLNYEGTNGLRGALDALRCPILDIEVDDVGITMDADTPEDLKALRRQRMENLSKGKLIPDIQIQISKGNTVLTPETAQFLEMIGHTGSIQSACSCVHMSYSRGWKLLNHMEKELGYPVIDRFPGGANGGGSILTEKGERLLKAYQNYRDAVYKSAEQLFADIFSDDLHGG